MSKGLKTPPLEQMKKKGFCKYHNFLSHKTYQCILLWDFVRDILKDGKMKFGEKPKSSMQIKPPTSPRGTSRRACRDHNGRDYRGSQHKGLRGEYDRLH